MMKQKLHFLIALFCMMSCSIGAYADDEVQWDSVSTASQFYSKIKANSSANIKLTADIDLSSHSSDDGCIFDITFSGRIDGTYTTDDGITSFHALKNSKEHLLFKALSGAEITNLIIQDCTFEGWDTHSGWIGAKATNCTFTDIYLCNVDGTGDSNAYDCEYMGGLIGEAESCTFTNIIAMDVDMVTDGYGIGCIAGKATGCTFTNITTNLLCSVYANGNFEDGVMTNTNGYAGGVVGYAENSTLSRCYNLALVSANDDRVGGVVGFGKGTKITDCNNFGIVIHIEELDDFKDLRDKITAVVASSYSYDTSMPLVALLVNPVVAAGAVGVAMMMCFGFDGVPGLYLSFNISMSATLSTVSAVAAAIMIPIEIFLIYSYQEPDEIGGIAGHMQGSSSVIGCTNYGYVHGSDAHVGGIVGYLKESSVSDCSNQHFVRGVEQTGGIVGTNDNGSIRTCLNVGMAHIEETADESIQIEGYTKGTVTVQNNCYTSYQDGTSTTERPVSQLSLASGSVAAYLNANTPNSEQRWTQTIGSELYPAPTAVVLDTTAISEANINTNVNTNHSVSSFSEFYSTLTNPAARISLTSDIDMENVSSSMYVRYATFSGAIYGNGHTIKNVNFSVDGSEDKTDALNTALFPITSHAVFDNIVLDSITVTQEEAIAGTVHTEAILAGTSNNCKYNNITLRNCSICLNWDKDYLSEVGGIVAISNSDTLTNCTAESTCKFQGYSGWRLTDTNVGGIASKAYNSVFTQCWNASSIWADDNQEGGIVAYASGCKIDRCLNTRGITAQENVGGICGNGYNTVITRCVNTAWISDDDNTREDKRAGIVGYLHGSGASISQCLNFGAINYADDDCGALEGCAKDGAKGAKNTNSFYYCGYNNGHADNQSEYSDESIFRIAKIQSGEFAYKSTIDQVEGADNWLYQSIDNNNGFATTYPVPISSAGTVYSNILCDGTQSYSNKYQSTEAHTSETDLEGYCLKCGSYLGTGDLHIKSAAYLCELAKAVNNGKDYSSYTIYLDEDIDMAYTDFTPIGTSDYPFTGTFDGQGHRIKNLTINNTTGYSGLFGYVGGLSTTGNNTYIKNVIIDSSCSITSTGKGVAGLVGAVTSLGNVIIQNCGNEANVSGSGNVAGLVGGMYDASVSTLGKVHLNVANSYNTGNITATIQSGTLCGLATVNCSIENCYNTGTISCKDKSTGLVYSSTKSYNITNSYDVNGAQCDGVTQITADQAHSGYLCQKLNSSSTVFTQELRSDTIPLPGTEGLKYTRTTPYKWGAIVLPYDVTISEDDLYKFYQISSYTLRDSTIYLTQMTGSLPAGTPAILCLSDTVKNAETDYYEYTWTCNGDVTTTINNPAEVDNLQLTGTFTDLDITNVAGYVIKKNTIALVSIAAEKESSGTVICPAYAAYIAGTPIIVGGNTNTFDFLNWGFGDTQTGIESNPEATNTTQISILTGIYDITGRKLDKMQKGVNIVTFNDGRTKKVIVK